VQAVASSIGLSRDVSPHFALFKDEGNNFGKRNWFVSMSFASGALKA